MIVSSNYRYALLLSDTMEYINIIINKKHSVFKGAFTNPFTAILSDILSDDPHSFRMLFFESKYSANFLSQRAYIDGDDFAQ